MGIFIGIITGLALAFGIAFYVTITLVKRTNDIGDSKGNLRDFGQLEMIIKQDDLKSCRPSERGKLILSDRLRNIKAE